MARVKSIELTAQEPGHVVRKAFPLTVGMPFAKGVLGADEPVAVVNAAGEAVALQRRVTETHADGSVRWMLLDYQADFEPLADSTYTLKLGKRGPAAPETGGIEIREQGNLLIVENGVLKLEIDKARCRPWVKVWQGGDLVSDGELSFRVTSDKGEQFWAANDGEVKFEIEESGPMRLLIRWEGTHKDEGGKGHFDFLVRLTVYAGKGFVRVEHVFYNRLDDAVTEVKEIVARVPVKLGGELSYLFAGNDEFNVGGTECDEPAVLKMHEFKTSEVVDRSGKVVAKGDGVYPSNGWASVNGANRGVLLAGKTFWQNYPKAIAVDEKGIDCYLIPARGGAFEVPMGMSKTHAFFVCFHESGNDAEEISALATQVQRWPMPAADVEYYQQSGGFWDVFGYYPQKYPRLEVSLRKFFVPDSRVLLYPPKNRAYGIKHYGDYVNGKSVGVKETLIERGPDPEAPTTYYQNNEYDTQHVLAMMFLRTREVVRFWGAETHALHAMDVDTRHHTPEAPPNEKLHDWKCLINCQYRHCYQHIGGIQEAGETRHVPAEGSHTFAEGMLDLYRLTGDRRWLDTATNYALHLAYMVNGSGYRWGLGRGSGWGILVMAGVYQIRPLEEIRQAVDALLDSIIADNKIKSDRYVNLALRGVIKWHQVSGDEKARKMILEETDSFLDSCEGDEGLPLYSLWPEHSKHTTEVQGFANLESLAYCYDLTGERRYIDAGVGLLCLAVDWINNPKVEKGLVLWMRILRGPFRFMQIAHELGILEKVPGADGWLKR